MKTTVALGLLLALAMCARTYAAENLRLNEKLDYTSDSHDGPLISGDHLEDGAAAGRVNYVIMYGEGCFNSKRQARRTVNLWEKYKGRVNFVIVDLDRKQSEAQQTLVSKYYRGYIPHVVILDKSGTAIYNQSGEVEESKLATLIEKALAAH
jgi:hypothetical protein